MKGMAILPKSSSTSLDLSISVPGFASSSSGERGENNNIIVRRDFDINQVPSEDQKKTTTTTAGGSIGGDDQEEDDEEEESGGSANTSTTPANGGGVPPAKKLRLTKEQSRLLEESFRQNHALNPKEKEELARRLTLKPRQVEVWFQNRRARSKLKQTEMECEYLKRWFGSLTEQNRKLHKEVEELRAMRVGFSPHSCEPLPPSTLTMCPRCERVSTTATNAAATTYENGVRTASAAMTFPVNMTAKPSLPVFLSRQPPAAC